MTNQEPTSEWEKEFDEKLGHWLKLVLHEADGKKYRRFTPKGVYMTIKRAQSITWADKVVECEIKGFIRSLHSRWQQETEQKVREARRETAKHLLDNADGMLSLNHFANAIISENSNNEMPQ